MTQRHETVLEYLPTAVGLDDFIARVEVALCGYGFTGSNSIGIKAGLSHSPVSKDARERYVFFTFPHIAIDMEGQQGGICRPNRPGRSCACGALQKALIELKAEGITRSTKIPGVHDPLDPEFTILKQRLARRIRYEHTDVRQMDLAELTEVAERVITDDLEYLIEKSVNPDKADFAVVAGIQIHNWAGDDAQGEPNLEFIAPSKVYVVVGGVTTVLDIMQLPALTPRQMSLLARQGPNGEYAGESAADEASVSNSSVPSTLVGFSSSYLARRMGSSSCCGEQLHHRQYSSRRLSRRRAVLQPSPSANGNGHNAHAAAAAESVPQGPCCTWPGWQSKVQHTVKRRRDIKAPTMDGEEPPHTSFTLRGLPSLCQANQASCLRPSFNSPAS
ncbi:hypothetical protein OEZ85_009409 [Tetradesmus obliquus]|uniref:Limiting CO2-inducible protein B/C beta carbonyic anhydrase domain-containing protein n=1 Tax=Tetradesmus obliquus TaxID=3088 RepID=A0ABY8U9Q4_TETOB|nr:hypothetical protein OEZ85_009409 [Tetradesmus obliquus]